MGADGGKDPLVEAEVPFCGEKLADLISASAVLMTFDIRRNRSVQRRSTRFDLDAGGEGRRVG